MIDKGRGYVAVDTETHNRLRDLSKQTGVSMGRILDALIARTTAEEIHRSIREQADSR